MSAIEDQFKINLNQNLWGLLLSFSGLGVAEHYGLFTLYWFSVVASVIMMLSMVITTYAYTVSYWRHKNGC
jgi:putative effector of murein hydrolase LrgA (UPF0299 family)